MIHCPNCNTENPENASFCMECGSRLEEDDTPDCPACNRGTLSDSSHKGMLGTKFYYNCNYCGAVFEEKGSKFKLIDIDDVENPIWQRYRNKPLTFDEWARIANGGMSDAEQKVRDAKERLKQKEAEKQQKKLALEAEERNKKELEARKEALINEFLNKLATGQINLTTTTASPIIPKKGEVSTMVMHNINFLEARAVRQTVGGYGGPSIRVAKGVSFRFGGVSARSMSHDELKKIDQGTLVLTNKRLIFLGSTRTINIDLRKIMAIEPFKDGIGSQRENKQKTEYFTGTDKTNLTINKDGQGVSFPVNGAVLKAAIMGNIAKLG